MRIYATTLLEIVKNLETLDSERTIYAGKPWTENSRALVLLESGEFPPEASNLNLNYFLEVSAAVNFLKDWAANLDTPPTPQQKCLRLIQYAINDA